MDAVNSELSASLRQYDEQAAGPTKYKRVAQFLLDVVFADGVKGLVVKAQEAAAAASTKLAAARKEAAEVWRYASPIRSPASPADPSTLNHRPLLLFP
jgi:hypothetical protein